MPSVTPLDLTVAVLTYEGTTLLPDCLESLAAQRWPAGRHELLLVDNGSSTPVSWSWPPAEESRPSLRLVRLPTNVGNIAGMNACFEQARGRWVCFVANDVRLRDRCLLRLWDARTPRSVVQPVLWQPNGELDNVGLAWRWPGYGDRLRRLVAVEGSWRIPAFTATCFLMAHEWWRTVGGFDAALGISHEDIDFSLRTTAAGGRCYAVGEAHALHLMGQTIGRVEGGRSLSPDYHRARMRVLRGAYRGLDQLTRRGMVALLDGLAAHRPRR